MIRRVLLPTLALVLAQSCELVDPRPSVQAGLLALAIDADSIPADSASHATLTATLRNDTQDTVSITFRTSSGSLPGGGTVKTAGNQATAILVAGNDAKLVLVTASARDFQATDSIRFYPAAPSRLVLIPNRTSATADGTSGITLTVELSRPQGSGVVSLRTPVTLIATDGSGNEVRDLRRTGTSGDKGAVTFSVTSITAGNFRFVAKSAGLSGDVADTVTLVFVPK